MPEPPWTAFVASLVLTVVLLALSAYTGKTARRKAHFVFVPCTIAALVGAILLAEETGSYWTFPATPLRIHLGFAYSASALTLIAATTGLLHVFGRVRRKTHARLAWTMLVAVVLATSTGIWIFTVGAPN